MDVQNTLIFRPARKQIRYLSLLTAGVALLAGAILLIRYAAGVSLPARALGTGIGAAVCTLLVGWVLYRYARAVTECSPAGIRSRGLTREWRCSWQAVREIAIRASTSRGQTTYTVVLTATDGGRLRLGMPVSGGIMPDPEFTAKVAEIRAYWRRATGARPVPAADDEIPADTSPAPRVRVRALTRLTIELLLIGAIVAVPFTLRAEGPALLARLGHGQRGYFTAEAQACDQNCYWVGDFRADDSPATRVAVPIAPGARISRTGGRVPAVYMGNGNFVYPAAGGPNWIPLAILFLVIACCLPAVMWWLARGYLSRRRAAIDYRPRPPDLPATRTVSSAAAGAFIGVLLVVLLFAGAAIAYWAQDVPVSVSARAVACAEYLAWAQTQPVAGSTDVSPGLLAAAVHAATGELRVDLSTLEADAGANIAAGGTSGSQPASLTVLGDMTAADQACT